MEKLDHSNYLDFCYDAKVLSIYDADTITVEVDLGFGIKTKQKIRFFGINTYEIRGEEREKGLIAKDFVVERIKDSKIKYYSIKDKTGKYGRYLGIIMYKKNDEWVNLNKELIENEHGKLFMV